ncbi:uncharacterized protein DEA37_0000802 [Paragonimus westermani]|uniref:Uncharacterized protein n=1 Tax=Paragonimus westermani TaxID=34504 RepID=A0A5J4P229_9TREM|nr:uncharacterized protein DEA37_0000802 [Paragonimus westermani]
MMYTTSVAVMFYILFYLYRNRLASMEAVKQGHVSASRILFSKRGESVSPYLRIGLCMFASMSIVFSVCRALQVVSLDNQLGRIAPYTVSRISFYIAQTVFLLLLHRVGQFEFSRCAKLITH